VLSAWRPGAVSIGGKYPVSEAGISEAWRGICKSWDKFSGLYECRGTKLIDSSE
jgi:hypothetical protein